MASRCLALAVLAASIALEGCALIRPATLEDVMREEQEVAGLPFSPSLRHERVGDPYDPRLREALDDAKASGVIASFTQDAPSRGASPEVIQARSALVLEGFRDGDFERVALHHGSGSYAGGSFYCASLWPHPDRWPATLRGQLELLAKADIKIAYFHGYIGDSLLFSTLPLSAPWVVIDVPRDGRPARVQRLVVYGQGLDEPYEWFTWAASRAEKALSAGDLPGAVTQVPGLPLLEDTLRPLFTELDMLAPQQHIGTNALAIQTQTGDMLRTLRAEATRQRAALAQHNGQEWSELVRAVGLLRTLDALALTTPEDVTRAVTLVNARLSAARQAGGVQAASAAVVAELERIARLLPDAAGRAALTPRDTVFRMEALARVDTFARAASSGPPGMATRRLFERDPARPLADEDPWLASAREPWRAAAIAEFERAAQEAEARGLLATAAFLATDADRIAGRLPAWKAAGWRTSTSVDEALHSHRLIARLVKRFLGKLPDKDRHARALGQHYASLLERSAFGDEARFWLANDKARMARLLGEGHALSLTLGEPESLLTARYESGRATRQVYDNVERDNSPAIAQWEAELNRLAESMAYIRAKNASISEGMPLTTSGSVKVSRVTGMAVELPRTAAENTRDREQALKELNQNSRTYEMLQREYRRLAQNPPSASVTVREGRKIGYLVKLQIWDGRLRRAVRLSGGGVSVTRWQEVNVKDERYAWVDPGQAVEAFNAWQTEEQVTEKHRGRFSSDMSKDLGLLADALVEGHMASYLDQGAATQGWTEDERRAEEAALRRAWPLAR